MEIKYERYTWPIRLIWLGLIEGIVALGYIFFNPANTKSAIFLGFTLAQWELIGCIGLVVVFHIFTMWQLKTSFSLLQFLRLLKSPWVFFISLLFWMVFIPVVYFLRVAPGTQVYLLRLAPLLIYIGLVSLQISIFHLLLSNGGTGLFRILECRLRAWQNILQSARGCSLMFTLSLCIPALFFNALRYDLPLGYAGMFTLMAEEISSFNFRLPGTVPYYGPGGTPFAYPPLGLYLMSLFIRLKVPVMFYLRFFPPLFALLALVILFFLVIEISESTLAASFAVLLVATSPALYETHLWAAGVVRGLAFALLLAALYCFVSTINHFSWWKTLLSGLFLGLVALTHLAYSVFFVVWVFAWLVTHPKFQNLFASLVAGLVGAVLAFPWAFVVVRRYGFGVFEGAYSSHGNATFLPILQDFSRRALPYLQNQLGVLLSNWLFAGLILLGCIYLISKAQFGLPVVLLAIAVFIYENNHYLVLLGGIIAGVFIAGVCQWLGSINVRHLLSVLGIILGLSLASLVIGYCYVNGFSSISQDKPSLSPSSFDVARFVQKQTPANASYLLVAQQDEAEWFPYLLERQPLVGQWGSEWLGTYYQQTGYLRKLHQCEREQDLPCIHDFIALVGNTPDYLITLKTRKKLNEALRVGSDWQAVYDNSRYMVWRYTE
jgi:hypothetical protein